MHSVVVSENSLTENFTIPKNERIFPAADKELFLSLELEVLSIITVPSSRLFQSHLLNFINSVSDSRRSTAFKL